MNGFAEVLYSAEYAYDLRGRVTNVVEQYGNQSDTAQSRSLQYDAHGRLLSEQVGNYQMAYEYDHLGNRTTQVGQTGSESYRYNVRNELTDILSRDVVLSYDENGSLTNKSNASSQTQYGWDSRGRLIHVRIDGDEVFRAEYAGGLKRLRKTEGDRGKTYRHDGMTVIEEVDQDGELNQLMRADRGGAAVGGILYSADDEGTNTFTYNGVGGTIVLSTDGGEARSVKYDAFGNILDSDEGIDTDRFANTKELDESTGLYFHGARYYDSETGRYISLDPARDGINHYIYANNAPLSYVDPTGLAFFLPFLGGLALSVGIIGFHDAVKNPPTYRILPKRVPEMSVAPPNPARSYRDTREGGSLNYSLSLIAHSSLLFDSLSGPLPLPLKYMGIAPTISKNMARIAPAPQSVCSRQTREIIDGLRDSPTFVDDFLGETLFNPLGFRFVNSEIRTKEPLDQLPGLYVVSNPQKANVYVSIESIFDDELFPFLDDLVAKNMAGGRHQPVWLLYGNHGTRYVKPSMMNDFATTDEIAKLMVSLNAKEKKAMKHSLSFRPNVYPIDISQRSADDIALLISRLGGDVVCGWCNSAYFPGLPTAMNPNRSDYRIWQIFENMSANKSPLDRPDPL